MRKLEAVRDWTPATESNDFHIVTVDIYTRKWRLFALLQSFTIKCDVILCNINIYIHEYKKPKGSTFESSVNKLGVLLRKLAQSCRTFVFVLHKKNMLMRVLPHQKQLSEDLTSRFTKLYKRVAVISTLHLA